MKIRQRIKYVALGVTITIAIAVSMCKRGVVCERG